mmetsp:Transcript_38908/g.64008  ORF Transcript_38908/g.64008 Transcript_38908/m.64008 type:complete len:796 (+) Transcript_38908:78-2465(+)
MEDPRNDYGSLSQEGRDAEMGGSLLPQNSSDLNSDNGTGVAGKIGKALVIPLLLMPLFLYANGSNIASSNHQEETKLTQFDGQHWSAGSSADDALASLSEIKGFLISSGSADAAPTPNNLAEVKEGDSLELNEPKPVYESDSLVLNEPKPVFESSGVKIVEDEDGNLVINLLSGNAYGQFKPHYEIMTDESGNIVMKVAQVHTTHFDAAKETPITQQNVVEKLPPINVEDHHTGDEASYSQNVVEDSQIADDVAIDVAEDLSMQDSIDNVMAKALAGLGLPEHEEDVLNLEDDSTIPGPIEMPPPAQKDLEEEEDATSSEMTEDAPTAEEERGDVMDVAVEDANGLDDATDDIPIISQQEEGLVDVEYMDSDSGVGDAGEEKTSPTVVSEEVRDDDDALDAKKDNAEETVDEVESVDDEESLGIIPEEMVIEGEPGDVAEQPGDEASTDAEALIADEEAVDGEEVNAVEAVIEEEAASQVDEETEMEQAANQADAEVGDDAEMGDAELDDEEAAKLAAKEAERVQKEVEKAERDAEREQEKAEREAAKSATTTAVAEPDVAAPAAPLAQKGSVKISDSGIPVAAIDFVGGNPFPQQDYTVVKGRTISELPTNRMVPKAKEKPVKPAADPSGSTAEKAEKVEVDDGIPTAGISSKPAEPTDQAGFGGFGDIPIAGGLDSSNSQGGDDAGILGGLLNIPVAGAGASSQNEDDAGILDGLLNIPVAGAAAEQITSAHDVDGSPAEAEEAAGSLGGFSLADIPVAGANANDEGELLDEASGSLGGLSLADIPVAGAGGF